MQPIPVYKLLVKEGFFDKEEDAKQAILKGRVFINRRCLGSDIQPIVGQQAPECYQIENGCYVTIEVRPGDGPPSKLYKKARVSV